MLCDRRPLAQIFGPGKLAAGEIPFDLGLLEVDSEILLRTPTGRTLKFTALRPRIAPRSVRVKSKQSI